MGWIWYWYNDKDWIPFDQKGIDHFEQEYARGLKTIKVDSERYLDLTLSHSDMVANFVSITDKDLIAIQRRYDDKMKRRAVKRTFVAEDFFKGLRFCSYQSYLGNAKSTKEYLELVDEIREYKGKISTSITGKTKVDYVLYSKDDLNPNDPAEFNKYLSAIEGYNCQPVKDEFVTACLKAKKLLDATPYAIKKKVVPKTKATASKPTTPVADTKPAAASAAAVVAATTTTTIDKKTKTADTKTAKNGKGVGKPKSTEYFLADSQWTGICKSDDDVYPMTLKVESIKDSKKTGESTVEGTIHWPTISDSITKYKATLNHSSAELNLEEYELVQGNEDEIELPNKYEATINTDEIEGTVDDMSFTLKLTKSPDVSVMRPNSIFKGNVTQYDKFKLKVTKRESDNTIEGYFIWPDYDNAKATFKGKVEDDKIEITNYKEGKVLGPEMANLPFHVKVTFDSNDTSLSNPIFTIEI